MKATYLNSYSKYQDCPTIEKPEYAFIGRSNVGKSSLINMLTERNGLAHTSSKPGKTQSINLFNIDDQWILTDLPGYGYAKTSKVEREKWFHMVHDYLLYRENLINVFLLVDGRHEPLKNDLQEIEWLAKNGIPFSIVLTKVDKLPRTKSGTILEVWKKLLGESWEELPPIFATSAEEGSGRKELLAYIEQINQNLSSNGK